MWIKVLEGELSFCTLVFLLSEGQGSNSSVAAGDGDALPYGCSPLGLGGAGICG